MSPVISPELVSLFLHRLITQKMNPALTRTSYGDNMRKQRRVLNEHLRAEMIRTVGQDVERQECKALLKGKRQLYQWPQSLLNILLTAHCRRFKSSGNI